jgi:FemAB-related protein (PEP-CTERM system-associated)
LRVISELTDDKRQAWDNYVKTAADGLPQHLSGWRDILFKTNGYETRYLMAQENEQVVGVLPLFLVRSVLVGNTATTMPGGLCADSDEIALELIERGREIARQAKAKCLRLHDTRQAWPAGLSTSSGHVHWIVDVRMGAEALWDQLHTNVRRQVRLAGRNDLTVEIDRTGECLGSFYDVFSRFTHQVGTPVFGRAFLENVIATFPGGFNIAIVSKARQPIGAFFQLQMGHTVYGVWGAALRDYLKLRPAYLVYWEILKEAASNGYYYLDMGRSPSDSNASKFKGQWGGVTKPVYQQIADFDNPQPVDEKANGMQADNKVQFVTWLWPKLPSPVAQFLGPKLRRHIPFG